MFGEEHTEKASLLKSSFGHLIFRSLRGEAEVIPWVLINYARYNNVWRSEGITPLFLTSALDRVERLASRPLSLYLRGNSP
jgi:hypothetical protein